MIQRDLETNAIKFVVFKFEPQHDENKIFGALLEFESLFSDEPQVSFHGLFMNMRGEFAQMLAATSMTELKRAVGRLETNQKAEGLFSLIQESSVSQYYHNLQSGRFPIPDNFNCFEHGVLKKKDSAYPEEKIQTLAENLRSKYLKNFENTLGHTYSHSDNGYYGELVFGKNLITTRQICFGYFQDKAGSEWLDAFDLSTANLSFWTLLG